MSGRRKADTMANIICQFPGIFCFYIRTNKTVRFVFLIFLLIFYCEFLHYYFVLLLCKWPTLPHIIQKCLADMGTDVIGGSHDFLPPRSDRSDEFQKLCDTWRVMWGIVMTWHQLASVVFSINFYILIFISETTGPIGTKLDRNVIGWFYY